MKIALKETSKSQTLMSSLIAFYSSQKWIQLRIRATSFRSVTITPEAYSRPRISLHCGNLVFGFSLIVWKEEILNGLSQLPDLRKKYHFSGKVN